MLTIIILAIIGVGLLVAKDHIRDSGGATIAKWVGIIALVVAAVLMLLFLVDAGPYTTDLD